MFFISYYRGRRSGLMARLYSEDDRTLGTPAIAPPPIIRRHRQSLEPVMPSRTLIYTYLLDLMTSSHMAHFTLQGRRVGVPIILFFFSSPVISVLVIEERKSQFLKKIILFFFGSDIFLYYNIASMVWCFKAYFSILMWYYDFFWLSFFFYSLFGVLERYHVIGDASAEYLWIIFYKVKGHSFIHLIQKNVFQRTVTGT